MTLYRQAFGPNGLARPVAISLPFISCIADEPRCQPPPPPTPCLPGERAPRMTDRFIRRALGKPGESLDPDFEAVMRRMERGVA
jgi:hypothetical protein